MLNQTSKKPLTLNKEPISVLDESKIDNVRGGTLSTMIQAVVFLAKAIHD